MYKIIRKPESVKNIRKHTKYVRKLQRSQERYKLGMRRRRSFTTVFYTITFKTNKFSNFFLNFIEHLLMMSLITSPHRG